LPQVEMRLGVRSKAVPESADAPSGKTATNTTYPASRTLLSKIVRDVSFLRTKLHAS
jgi:hypothetical protein